MRETSKDSLKVFYREDEVGQLRLLSEGFIAFSYSERWLKEGFSISPFSLPLHPGVFIPKDRSFGGLFGVFADSLPDSWGNFVTDQYLSSQGIDPASLSLLTRLALLGDNALGALTYRKESENEIGQPYDFEKIKKDCDLLLEKKNEAPLEELMRLGGSSGGAHPKVHIKRQDGTSWIVKFPGPLENRSVSQQEFDYNQTAKECGLDLPPFALLGTGENRYFASERFDRLGKKRIHVLSLSGLYEAPLEGRLLDYGHLLSGALRLSLDEEEAWKAFRLMCFNVYAHNCDDHTKNFSFLYDETKKHYCLAPAYDLTYPGMERGHRLLVNHSFYPKDEDLLALAKTFSLNEEKSRSIMAVTREIVEKRLAHYWK